MRQLVGWGELKGAASVLLAGASLSFVPHEIRPKRRFHRTEKGARMDVCRSPSWEASFRGQRVRFPTTLDDEGRYRAEVEATWASEGADLLRWLDETRTLEGLAGWLVAAPWVPFGPDRKLVLAAVLKRIGREDAARTAFAAARIPAEERADWARGIALD